MLKKKQSCAAAKAGPRVIVRAETVTNWNKLTDTRLQLPCRRVAGKVAKWRRQLFLWIAIKVTLYLVCHMSVQVLWRMLKCSGRSPGMKSCFVLTCFFDRLIMALSTTQTKVHEQHSSFISDQKQNISNQIRESPSNTWYVKINTNLNNMW